MHSKTRFGHAGGVTVCASSVLYLVYNLVLPLAAIATGLALFAADLTSASRLSHATCSFPLFVGRTLAWMAQMSSRPRRRLVPQRPVMRTWFLHNRGRILYRHVTCVARLNKP